MVVLYFINDDDSDDDDDDDTISVVDNSSVAIGIAIVANVIIAIASRLYTALMLFSCCILPTIK